MVHGLEKFKAYFNQHSHQYVLIGGTACDLLLDEIGGAFRATKDLDMVLIVDNSIGLLTQRIHCFLK